MFSMELTSTYKEVLMGTQKKFCKYSHGNLTERVLTFESFVLRIIMLFYFLINFYNAECTNL